MGKNFLSDDFCMINSQIYLRNADSIMERKGYLNLKIVSGHCLKSGNSVHASVVSGSSDRDGDQESTPIQIAAALGRMVELTPWTACAIPETFKRWGKSYTGNFQPNWFLPVHLGGYGLDIKYSQEDLQITRDQRKMAARFVADPLTSLFRVRGLNVPSKFVPGALLNPRVVYGSYVPESNESFDADESWLNKLAYAAQAARTAFVNDKVVMSRLLKTFKRSDRIAAKDGQRLSQQLSGRKLVEYWTARFISTHTVQAPNWAPPHITPGRYRPKKRTGHATEVRAMLDVFHPLTNRAVEAHASHPSL